MKDPWQAGFDPQGGRDVDLSQGGHRQAGAGALCQVHRAQSHVHGRQVASVQFTWKGGEGAGDAVSASTLTCSNAARATAGRHVTSGRRYRKTSSFRKHFLHPSFGYWTAGIVGMQSIV